MKTNLQISIDKMIARDRSKKERQENPEYFKQYFIKEAERMRIHAVNNFHKMRDELICLLGNKCSNCGFSDKRALNIAHVKHNGASERKENGSSYKYIRLILQKVKAGTRNYKLLCANCNSIERYESGKNGGRPRIR